jgi:uncharacterized membrane protein
MFHLIHPALVHFSVAFLIFGAACEAWALMTDRAAAARFGERMIILGVLSLALSIASGYVAANTVTLTGEGQRLLDLHERNAWFVVGAFVAALFWKGWVRGTLPKTQRPLYALLLLAAVALTAYSAYLGGKLVYIEGVGVRLGALPLLPAAVAVRQRTPRMARRACPAICGFSRSRRTE